LRFRYSAEENGVPVKKAVVYTQDEHKINYHDVDSHAVYITERLQASGYETYIVGGAVRDLILGKKPKDFDIVTAASPPRIKKIFRNARIIGKRFRLVHVFFGAKIIEVSTFRSTKDGHTGNTFGTIEEDVLRRDFSLNALFYDPLKQLVVDYIGGMEDIRKGVIRPLIPLSHIFTDDPVRIIRAVKYAAVAGFKMPFSLKRVIRKQSYLLADVSPSRLTEEIFKIIYSTHALEIVEALINFKIYGYLQPEAVGLFNTLPCFKEKYLKTIAALGGEGFKNSSGEALSSLIKDYLEETVDWNGSQGIGELYRSAFILARKFVLPMNPPRIELDHALRIIFAGHGLHVKRVRFNGYHHRKPDAVTAAKQDT
jgi:poly(A) polymerase